MIEVDRLRNPLNRTDTGNFVPSKKTKKNLFEFYTQVAKENILPIRKLKHLPFNVHAFEFYLETFEFSEQLKAQLERFCMNA